MSDLTTFSRFKDLNNYDLIRFQIWRHAIEFENKILELVECDTNHDRGSCFVEHEEKGRNTKRCCNHTPAELLSPARSSCSCGLLGNGHPQEEISVPKCRYSCLWHLCRGGSSPISPLFHVNMDSRHESLLGSDYLTIQARRQGSSVEHSIKLPFNPREQTLAISSYHLGEFMDRQKREMEGRKSSLTMVENLKMVTKLILLSNSEEFIQLFSERYGRPPDLDSFHVLKLLKLFPRLEVLHLTHCCGENSSGPLVLCQPAQPIPGPQKGYRIFSLFTRQLNFMLEKLGRRRLDIKLCCVTRGGKNDKKGHCDEFYTQWYHPRDEKYQKWVPYLDAMWGYEGKGMRGKVEQKLRAAGVVCSNCSLNADCGEGFLCRETRREVKIWEREGNALRLGPEIDDDWVEPATPKNNAQDQQPQVQYLGEEMELDEDHDDAGIRIMELESNIRLGFI